MFRLPHVRAASPREHGISPFEINNPVKKSNEATITHGFVVREITSAKRLLSRRQHTGSI